MNHKFTRPPAQYNQFRFFSTCSPSMLFNGINVELNMSFDQKQCKKYLKTKMQSIIGNIQQFDLLIYLPGGIPFINGTLNDVFSNSSVPKVKHYIYGILTRPIPDKYLDDIYVNLCDISTPEKKLLFSPIYDSTISGLCNISCLLGYFHYGCKFSDKFHEIISSIIPFPPFSTSFIRLIETDTSITGRDIITITSTLHTYFSHLINLSKPPDQIFDYSIKIFSIIMSLNQPPNFPIQNMILSDKNKTPNFWPLTVSERSIYINIYFWRGDLTDSEDEYNVLNQIDIDRIENANTNCFTSIPFHGYSILERKDHCYLFYLEINIEYNLCKVIDPITGIKKRFKDLEDFLWNFKDIKIDMNS